MKRATGCLALLLFVVCVGAQSRSAKRAEPAHHAEPSRFDPSESAALFVGIRYFTHDTSLSEVPYAVDDAIDLAFEFALDPNVRLVEPGRVVLALSGDPQKAVSQQHLNALVAAGATVKQAGQSDILLLMEQQARVVGKNGLLIVTVATHGFSRDGTPYVIAANSLFRHPESALATNKLLDMAVASESPRSLLFFDACRMRLTSSRAEGDADPRSVAPFLDATGRAQGQVVLYAAAAGDYAYDDEDLGNGVFTAALLDGLRCSAATDPYGFITVETLSNYVDGRVKKWVTQHREREPAQGIQFTFGGGMKSMPVAICRDTVVVMGDERTYFARVVQGFLSALIDRLSTMPMLDVSSIVTSLGAKLGRHKPVTVRAAEGVFNAFDGEGMRVSGGQVAGTIVQAEVADLDGDDVGEVILGVAGEGVDSGTLQVFDANGRRWSASLAADLNYDGAHSGRMTLRAFATGDLFRTGKRQVAAIGIDAQGWYPSRLAVFDSDGKLLSSYWHPGHLHSVMIGAPTIKDEPRIVLAGVNNDLTAALGMKGYVNTICVLDPKNISGEAPPFHGQAGEGTQLWYGVVLPETERLERVELADHGRDGVKEISLWTTSKTVLYVSFAGKLVARQRGYGGEGPAQTSR